MLENSDVKKHLWLIAGLVFLIYANSLFFYFCIDDFPLIIENDFIKDLKNLSGIFKSTYFANTLQLSYRPIETLAFFIDYRFFKLNPFGWHLHNVILAAINCLLLYLVVYAISRNTKIALFSSLIFAVHPAHSEPISVINYRDDLQVLFFAFVALYFYIQSKRASTLRKQKSYFGGSFLCVLLGLLSKESAIPIVGFLFLYEYTFAKSDLKQSLKKISPYLFLTILYLVGRFTFLRNPGEGYYESLIDRLQILPRVVSMQLWQLFIPYPLYGYYHFLLPGTFMRLDIIVLYLLILVIALLYLKLFFRSQKNSLQIYATFSLGWILVSLIPVSNIYPLAWPHVEKYLYIPSVGVSILLGYLVWLYYKKRGGPQNKYNPAVYIFTSMIILLGVYSASRNYIWSNNLTFWKNASRKYKNRFVCYNLGTSLMAADRLGEAEVWLKRATTTQLNVYKQKAFRNVPPLAFCNLGAIYLDSGNYEEGLMYFKKTLELNPHDYRAATGAAACSFNLGNFKNAKKYCEMAIKLNPGDTWCKNLLHDINNRIHSE